MLYIQYLIYNCMLCYTLARLKSTFAMFACTKLCILCIFYIVYLLSMPYNTFTQFKAPLAMFACPELYCIYCTLYSCTYTSLFSLLLLCLLVADSPPDSSLLSPPLYSYFVYCILCVRYSLTV